MYLPDSQMWLDAFNKGKSGHFRFSFQAYDYVYFSRNTEDAIYTQSIQDAETGEITTTVLSEYHYDYSDGGHYALNKRFLNPSKEIQVYSFLRSATQGLGGWTKPQSIIEYRDSSSYDYSHDDGIYWQRQSYSTNFDYRQSYGDGVTTP